MLERPTANYEHTREHLRLLFAGAMPTELIEIAFTAPEAFVPNQARLFPVSEIDAAATFALERNAEGSNVYVGPNPRRSETPKGKRAATKDVSRCFFCFADCDGGESIEQVGRWRNQHPSPGVAFSVRTGNVPEMREHLYFRLEAPTKNFSEWRSVQESLASAFSGDAVIDAGRIMRLAGTVNFPNPDKQQRGYVPETVRLLSGNGSCVKLTDLMAASRDGIVVDPVPLENPIPIGALDLTNEYHGPRIDIDALKSDVRAGNWHNPVLRIVASLVGRGYSESEIHRVTDQLTLEGFTIDDTRRDVKVMIEGALVKGYAQRPTVDAIAAAAFDNVVPLPTPQQIPSHQHRPPMPFDSLLDKGTDTVEWHREKPPIDWTIRDSLPRGVAGVFAAVGGLGKSYKCLELALRVSSGFPEPEFTEPILGGQVAANGAVVFITAEDTKDAVLRRLWDLDPTRHRRTHKLKVVCLADLDAEKSIEDRYDGQLILVEKDQRGIASFTPQYFEFIRQLQEVPNLALIILDPVTSFLAGEVQNDNDAVRMFMQGLNRIARALNASIICTHHMRKPSGNMGPHDTQEVLHSVRGAGAWVDNSRWVFTAWYANRDDAKDIWVAISDAELGPLKDRSVVYGAIAKANTPHDGRRRIYCRTKHGLLIDYQNKYEKARLPLDSEDELLVEIVKRAAEDGYPFTKTSETTGIYARRLELIKPLNSKTRDDLLSTIERLLRQKKLTGGTSKQPYLDVQGGPYAKGKRVTNKGRWPADLSDLEKRYVRCS